ncbi:OmpA/MotB family protein [Pseudodesulfovibrio sediminis]|uniref:Membrane protein n=1 Tax=Pseudodesulfovibrio sediminis TaxID=2810563 RepID=A0ABM7P4Q7_9BACT|nr:flagellar motor protein MotB [Pseudodesulfovibrio sediminis]BCS88607.1 membrane protein [Pseudodesulfovibrio sediminis]
MQFNGKFIPKRKTPAPDGGWQLTLADMMTLILCFFVIMLAVSKIDPNRYEAVSDIMAEAMKGKAAPSKRASEPVQAVVEKKQKNLFELQLELAKLIGRESEAVRLKLRPDAVAINLQGGVFFKLGSADLTVEAVTILDKLAKPLTDAHYKLTIEGHSDNLAIKSAQFPSNWELSSARASSVARFFIAQGFPKGDIRVMGLADTEPLAPNTDKAGNNIPTNQAKNRRVIILVRPISGR